MSEPSDREERRAFLSHLGLGAAALGVGLATVRPAEAQTTVFKPQRHEQDAWMDAPRGGHRIVIDSAFPSGGGAALLYANNNFLANKSGYGLETDDIGIIVVFRHLSTPFAYSDAIWEKYGAVFSETIDFKDPKTNAAPVSNLYNAVAPGVSLSNRGVTIPSLVAKNVQFAVCGSATRFMANAIAQKTKGDAGATFDELTSNLIPNSHLVAAGVVAVNRAQEYGYTLLTAM